MINELNSKLKKLYRITSKNSKMTDQQKSVSRKREAGNTKLEIFRSPNSSPTRPIVIVPPIKRIKSYGVFAQQKSAVHIAKALSIETKQITKVEKIVQPFAINICVDTYKQNIMKRINNFEERKSAAANIKTLNVKTKKIKTADKMTQPFAIRSSMETYAYKQNSFFPKPISDSFAQKRKVAQVEPFKVFDEDQPLDLSVKKKKVVIENVKMTEAKLSKETEEHIKKSKF